jgi:heme/copper-type cytochrome/quinol oxidase subunit 3
MIHPLFRLLVSEPQMLAEHAEAYAELVSEEAGAVAQRMKRKMVLHAVSALAFFLALILACMGLMLWAALPVAEMRSPWGVIAVPAVALLIGVAAHLAARSRADEERGIKVIREQLAADAAMLRGVTEA